MTACSRGRKSFPLVHGGSCDILADRRSSFNVGVEGVGVVGVIAALEKRKGEGVKEGK